MKKAGLIFFMLLAIYPAIAKQHKPNKKGKQRNEIKSITMQRTGCYGRCPAYIISLNKDGIATYTGQRFTTDTGILTKNIGKWVIADVFNLAMTNRVDTCKDEYTAKNTDMPGMILTIKYAKTTKTINNANFGPAVLRQLADAMDNAGGKAIDHSAWKRPAMHH